ncbi:MAG: hypothetical protein A2268_08365 [Candidatus Raymondbacteria bacterium RifOxyA12_full_50_37]|uniref:Pseudouridine synthase n=1 Tax=Candidatus Raymondbacteria bacterium RIFOXYD12_FULL_49_13 TaxID=1817890 RepID=A0A1F7F460_UNCRA|nr:MAG: hypothetical protein A2268_08365 [Candidatus Raymondbacteria bacterium RifOxyA12_full_50_37]OGJ90347.1 MAG: hypothetical protein A2248_17300 [Candidatus Raymondbacteria bacterium RIFOXYA2_FULL_49_16]OGK01317.1 MAG: hypothetical protein A2519_13020 [Candidatus Raymondbacteria bacterium RIFOXYD12_FULL_49_13]OGP43246.1 MAG: hypothetical protein A2324_08130 [Candidatus Raymondbacteria bacterium RIFOXYB2_FULL_49_35]
MQSIAITINDAGQRLDKFLRKAFKGTPLSLIHKSIRKGLVRVNGKKKDSDFFLSEKDLLEIREDLFRNVSTTHAAPKPSFDIAPRILYESDEYILINKPAGIAVHGYPGHYKATVLEVLQHYLKAQSNTASLTFQPQLAHRLDRDTSGVVAVAKNAAALRYLAELFRTRAVDKKYLAIIEGSMLPRNGTLDQPLTNKEGKTQEARTGYRTMRTENGLSLLECTLHTGRMHQIRRHLADAGHPIAGDDLYRGKKNKQLLLHSSTLSFAAQDGQRISVKAPLPDYFMELIETT